MKKVILVAVEMFVVNMCAFAGYKAGESMGLGTEPNILLCIANATVGFLMVLWIHYIGADSKSEGRPAIVRDDDLEPGLYESLCCGCTKGGTYYHVVVPITDHKDGVAWFDDPLLVRQVVAIIPSGRFEVTTARKSVVPVEGPGLLSES